MMPLRSAVYCSIAVLAVMLLGEAVPSSAQTADDPSPHSEATLVTATAPIAPGEPFTVGLRIRMEDGWHSYWKNPGDSGEPTSIDWQLPDGFSAESIRWPYPERIPFGPMTSYGYSDEVVLPVTITPPDTLSPGTTVTLKGQASWLICADICLPAEASLERSIPVASSAADGSDAARIAAARDKQPQAVDGWSVRAARSSGSYTLALTPPDNRQPSLDGAYFFPAEKDVLDHTAPQPVSRAGETYLMTLQQSEYADAPADTLAGVVVAPEGTSWDAAGGGGGRGDAVRRRRALPTVGSALCLCGGTALEPDALRLSGPVRQDSGLCGGGGGDGRGHAAARGPVRGGRAGIDVGSGRGVAGRSRRREPGGMGLSAAVADVCGPDGALVLRDWAEPAGRV